MVSDVRIIGTVNNPPYSSVVPVSTTLDGDSTSRLSVSTGIAKQGQISNFKSLFSDFGALGAGTVLYTAPAQKTFYVNNIIVTGQDAGNSGGLQFNVVNPDGSISQSVVLVVNNHDTLILTSYHPILIITNGQKLVGSNGTLTTHSNIFAITFTGYEEYGSTN